MARRAPLVDDARDLAIPGDRRRARIVRAQLRRQPPAATRTSEETTRFIGLTIDLPRALQSIDAALIWLALAAARRRGWACTRAQHGSAAGRRRAPARRATEDRRAESVHRSRLRLPDGSRHPLERSGQVSALRHGARRRHSRPDRISHRPDRHAEAGAAERDGPPHVRGLRSVEGPTRSRSSRSFTKSSFTPSSSAATCSSSSTIIRPGTTGRFTTTSRFRSPACTACSAISIRRRPRRSCITDTIFVAGAEAPRRAAGARLLDEGRREPEDRVLDQPARARSPASPRRCASSVAPGDGLAEVSRRLGSHAGRERRPHRHDAHASVHRRRQPADAVQPRRSRARASTASGCSSSATAIVNTAHFDVPVRRGHQNRSADASRPSTSRLRSGRA